MIAFVCVATFDTSWLRRLRAVSRIQRSSSGQKIIGYAKSLRSTPLGPCKTIPSLANVFVCSGPHQPDVTATRAQVHALIAASAIPCQLAAAPSTAGLALNTSPPVLFSLSAEPLVCLVNPESSHSSTGAPGCSHGLAAFLASITGPLSSNRRLPTAKSFLLNLVALQPVFLHHLSPTAYPSASISAGGPKATASHSHAEGLHRHPTPGAASSRNRHGKQPKASASRSLPSLSQT